MELFNIYGKTEDQVRYASEIDAAIKEFKDENILGLMEHSNPFIDSTVGPISTNLRKINSIYVIGCGGTGSWFMPKIVKTINDLNRKELLSNNFRFIIVDKDTVEAKNLWRQNFIQLDISTCKAEVMAERYFPTLFDPSCGRFVKKYIASSEEKDFDKDHYTSLMNLLVDPEMHMWNASNHFSGANLVFNFVDNDNARIAVHDDCMRFASEYSSNVIVVDVGNETTYGQLYASYYSPWSCPKIENNILNFYGSLNKDDKVALFSCAEADEDESLADQFLVANDTAATVAHNWLATFCDTAFFNKTSYLPKLIRFKCVGPLTSVTVEEYMFNSIYRKAFVDSDKIIEQVRDTFGIDEIALLNCLGYYLRGEFNLTSGSPILKYGSKSSSLKNDNYYNVRTTVERFLSDESFEPLMNNFRRRIGNMYGTNDHGGNYRGDLLYNLSLYQIIAIKSNL